MNKYIYIITANSYLLKCIENCCMQVHTIISSNCWLNCTPISNPYELTFNSFYLVNSYNYIFKYFSVRNRHRSLTFNKVLHHNEIPCKNCYNSFSPNCVNINLFCKIIRNFAQNQSVFRSIIRIFSNKNYKIEV